MLEKTLLAKRGQQSLIQRIALISKNNLGKLMYSLKSNKLSV
jgi:hypothetical protein